MRAILLGIIVLGATLGGCRKRPEAPPEPVRILATTQAMADIAKTIGGKYVAVEWYVESGQSLAELLETPERRASYRQAELVVTRGASDPWTLEGYANTYQDRKIIRLDTLLAARENDPALYLWLDPEAAIDLSQTIAERLSVLEPRGSATYKANAEKFRQAVAELMENATASINRSGGGGAFLTLDRGFLPLARRFGLHEVRAPSISLVEPTNYNVKVLKHAATDAGAGAIFANSELPAPLLRDWESRLGMPVLSLDALGTSSPTGRHTYLEMLRYNLDQLATGAARNTPTTRSNQFVGEQTGEVKPQYPRGRSAVEERVEVEDTSLSRQRTISSNPFTPETRSTPKVELPKPESPSTRQKSDVEYRRDRTVPSNPFAPGR